MKSNIRIPTLKGLGFTLRPFRKGDESSLQTSINDERVARKVSHIPYPYTRAHASAWVSSAARFVVPGSKRVDFAIVVARKVVGSVAFINLDDHKGQISYWLTPSLWGKGIITEAVRLLVEFGFGKLDLVRIYAYTYADNRASTRVLEKAGFSFEGVHRKEWHHTIEGKERYFDSKYFAIVAGGF